MGLSADESQRRRDDERVKYITKNIRNAASEENYVFISYKSDDWEIVLGDIVYKLVKDYGLNVYFDGDFNAHNSLWTKQFPENMEAKNCRGVLAFIDDLYTQSYATLMELLYSQAGCQDEDTYKYVKKPVIPVYIGQISNICDKSDTGLGVDYYEDGIANLHAADEKELFEELFKTASESFSILKNTRRPYKKEKKLTKQLCAAMCREVISSIGANDNLYGAGVTLEDIVNTIKDQCGDTVFGPPDVTDPPKPPILTDPPNPTELTDPPEPPKPQPITIREMIKIFDISTLKKDSFAGVQILSSVGNKALETSWCQSMFELTWQFVMNCLKQNPQYLDMAVEKHAGVKFPPFIGKSEYESRPEEERKKYKLIEGVPGIVDCYMFRHLGQYGWLTTLRARIQDFGLNMEDYVIAYEEPNAEASRLIQAFYEKMERKSRKNKSLDRNPISTGTVVTNEATIYRYTYQGKEYMAKKLAEYMHHVFDLLAADYPDRMEAAADREDISFVARKDDVENGILPANKLNYFIAKREHRVGNSLYYVSNRYNQAQGTAQVEKLVKLCGADTFRLIEKPEPNKKNAEGGNS